MTKGTKDNGTTYPSDAAALIATAGGKLELALPKGADGADIPPNVQLLVAVMIKSKDPEWANYMIASLNALDEDG